MREFEDWLPRVIRTPPACSCKWLCSDWLETQRHERSEKVKEAVVAYGMHLLYVRQVLNNWATQNSYSETRLKDLMTVILEASSQLQWLTWWREDAAAMGQGNQTTDMNIAKGRLLGEAVSQSANTKAVWWCYYGEVSSSGFKCLG